MLYASTRNGLLQYLQWITPVLAVDYSSTRNRLRRYSCVNRRKSPFKKEAYTLNQKKYNDGRNNGIALFSLGGLIKGLERVVSSRPAIL